ncbi:hypothetical protein PRIPAC_88592 [Pristionchus pacificus]|uniref:Uncharacterized protein n=1 Tax=Pristionchus pacificus TaxID=54126 RepID=A0A2A6CT48_PRIPA|nr:hypothetical protein PRIPAC_88592 [Pristionchus pacificus]|eukprot:PDM81365.1 hypothetical protein PRIPAC_35241 [Pristionchus pacificus]
MVVRYELISVSSEDEESIKQFRKEQPSILEIEGNGVCWISEKNRGYPQSLILKLDQTSDIFRIDVTAHPQLIPSSMTVHFGQPTPGKHRHTTGNSYDADYTQKGTVNFVEGEHVNTKQTVLTSGEAQYIRFTTHGFYKTSKNAHSQVGVISIVLNGNSSSYGGLSFSSDSSSPNSPRGHSSTSDTVPSIIGPTPDTTPSNTPRAYSSSPEYLIPLMPLDSISDKGDYQITDKGTKPHPPLSPRPIGDVKDTNEDSEMRTEPFKKNEPPKALRELSPPRRIVVSPYEPKNAKNIAVPVRPISRETVIMPPMLSLKPVNIPEDDSDEEEVIFTRQMITRLNNSLIAQNEKPVPVSEERYRKGDKKKRAPSASKERLSSGSAKPKTAERPPSAVSTASTVAAAAAAPAAVAAAPTLSKAEAMLAKDKLDASELKDVLNEIEAYEGTMDPNALKITPDGLDIINDKKYYFRSRLAELHNVQRLLEQRKEEALFREQYSQAGGIDKCLQQLRLREEPLKELLIERMDALQKADYDEAQVQKDRFEINLEAALDIPDLKKFISAKEMTRIRKDAKDRPNKD